MLRSNPLITIGEFFLYFIMVSIALPNIAVIESTWLAYNMMCFINIYSTYQRSPLLVLGCFKGSFYKTPVSLRVV